MEGLIILLGLVLRVGVPLALTLLIARWLRRLDARWQREAEADQAGRWAAARPCWEIRGCPPERRALCPASAHPDTPCWQLFREAGGALQARCLDCAVYRGAALAAA